MGTAACELRRSWRNRIFVFPSFSSSANSKCASCCAPDSLVASRTSRKTRRRVLKAGAIDEPVIVCRLNRREASSVG
jgi:hypothetical protein